MNKSGLKSLNQILSLGGKRSSMSNIIDQKQQAKKLLLHSQYEESLSPASKPIKTSLIYNVRNQIQTPKSDGSRRSLFKFKGKQHDSMNFTKEKKKQAEMLEQIYKFDNIKSSNQVREMETFFNSTMN